MAEEPGDERASQGAWRRWFPLAVFLLLLALAYLSGLYRYLSFATLREHLDSLQAMIAAHRFVAVVALVVFYAILAAFSFPAMSLVTIAAGMLFGLWTGFLAVVVGASIGATLLFLIVRTALGDSLRRKAGPWLARFESGFQADEFHYLLALRLIPVFPFWVVNIAPAILGMRLRNFVLATMLGIIPGTFVYVWVGVGAAETIRLGGTVDPSAMLREPQILGPLVALAILALLPVLVRRWRRVRRSDANGASGS
ncbi:MAG: TVP38/TMEM64 family protein [Alphaproteobacteria bacterium]|nr:MAG: TVP38/TMEM64 family protein [Alphaproteobacteria bacterium]